MAFRFKIDVFDELKKQNYFVSDDFVKNLFSETFPRDVKNNDLSSLDDLETLSFLLSCKPGDIVEFVPEDTADKTGEFTDSTMKGDV